MPTIYNPVSKIQSGGWVNTRPAQVAELGVDLIWEGSIVTDDFTYIIWDNGDRIAWEA